MKTLGLGSAPAYALVGDVYAILLTGEDTGGAFALVHAAVPPGGGPPMHIHSREDETFYVLGGVVTIFRARPEGGVEEVRAGPGTVVHLARGVAHRFENREDAPARMLIQTAPAGFERMVMEAGVALAPGASEPPPPAEGDVERLIEACTRAGIEILPRE